jgi:DNA (cytosine-5)-methyltransferase 1
MSWLVGWSEIDKYAIQAHNAVYPQWADRNFGDISKIDWENVPDFDLFTYSFPCTDISSAGKQQGLAKDSGTRSSLLWECQKAIEIKRPKYCLMENVAALVSEKFRPFFLEWERLMSRYGYTNYNKVLNAKDYGIPQNRERIFMVSIHNAEQTYYWPEPMKLEKRLKDVLEQNVDEKYYLSDRMMQRFMKTDADKSHGHNFNPKTGEDIAFTIRTAPGSRVDDTFIKEDSDMTIISINHVSHVNPSGSSGTGYSGYDVIEIQYSNGENQRIKLQTWYMPKECIMEEFMKSLRYVIPENEKVSSMLFNSLKGFVPDNYIKENG